MYVEFVDEACDLLCVEPDLPLRLEQRAHVRVARGRRGPARHWMGSPAVFAKKAFKKTTWEGIRWVCDALLLPCYASRSFVGFWGCVAHNSERSTQVLKCGALPALANATTGLARSWGKGASAGG